jgi:hypothetical protein
LKSFGGVGVSGLNFFVPTGVKNAPRVPSDPSYQSKVGLKSQGQLPGAISGGCFHIQRLCACLKLTLRGVVLISYLIFQGVSRF